MHLDVLPQVAIVYGYANVNRIAVDAFMATGARGIIYHYARSKEARKVVVSIEQKQEFYDDKDNFIFQEPGTSYAYGRFAGG